MVVGMMATGTALSLGDGSEMGGFGVLHFGRLNWDTVVDDRNVVGAGMMDGSRSIMTGGAGIVDIVTGTALGFSDGSKVSGLGVLHFGCVYWDTVVDDRNRSVVSDGSMMVGRGGRCVMVDGCTVVGSSVGSEMGGFGVLDFGCVYWNSVVDLNGCGGSPVVTPVCGSLVQMMMTGQSLSVSGEVGNLGGMYFGRIVRDTVGGNTMRPWSSMGQWSRNMGIGHSWGMSVMVSV